MGLKTRLYTILACIIIYACEIIRNKIKKEPRQALFLYGGQMTLSFSVVRLALCITNIP